MPILPPPVQALYHRVDTLAARANLLRYAVVYEHGGLYVDGDCRCQRSVEPLFGAAGLVVGATQTKSESRYPWRPENAFIAARPRHPLLHRILEEAPEFFRPFCGGGGPANRPCVPGAHGSRLVTRPD
jgi:mannosyltransferase OCH1-like enzyme